ncbi:MAG: TolC family protein, partial [Gemmatimonadota bacterium]
YLETLKQEAIAKLARELLEARRLDVEAAEARFRIATASESDLLGARIEASRQEAALFDAEAEAAKAREGLAVLLGLTHLDGYRVRDTFSEEDLDPARLDLDALTAKSALHPAVLRREAELDAASRTAWIRRSAYLPSLWLSLGLSRSETQGAEGDFVVLDPENRSTFLSIGASWSLFDGFQRQVENARAGAERDAARYAAAQARREQEAVIRNAHRDLQSAHRRLRLAGESLDLARRRVRIARERYRLGSAEMPFWALQEVLRQATEAEREAVAARYDYLQAAADLEGAVGEPLASWTGTSP